jgi:hypothetical protein
MENKARAPDSKPYVQFSKRMVVLVVASALVISLLGIVLCALVGAPEDAGVVAIIKTYIGFAIVVFTAYSGNSAVEKWLVSKYGKGENNG